MDLELAPRARAEGVCVRALPPLPTRGARVCVTLGTAQSVHTCPFTPRVPDGDASVHTADRWRVGSLRDGSEGDGLLMYGRCIILYYDCARIWDTACVQIVHTVKLRIP